MNDEQRSIKETGNTREGVMVIAYRDRPNHEREFIYVENLRTKNHTWVSGGTDGEPFDVAARRELKEETDLDALELIPTEIVHEFRYNNGQGDPGKQNVFVAKVDPAQEVHIPTDEISDVFWIQYEDAEERLTFPEHVDILHQLRKMELV